MSDSTLDEKDLIRNFPKVPFTVWSRIHNLPVQRIMCLGCKKMVLTSRPFTLEHPKTKAAVVGLTTDKNGQHDCDGGFGIDIARMVGDKKLNIEGSGGNL